MRFWTEGGPAQTLVFGKTALLPNNPIVGVAGKGSTARANRVNGGSCPLTKCMAGRCLAVVWPLSGRCKTVEEQILPTAWVRKEGFINYDGNQVDLLLVDDHQLS